MPAVMPFVLGPLIFGFGLPIADSGAVGTAPTMAPIPLLAPTMTAA